MKNLKSVENFLDSFARQVVSDAKGFLQKAKGQTKLANTIYFNLKEAGDYFIVEFSMADYGTFVDKGVRGAGGKSPDTSKRIFKLANTNLTEVATFAATTADGAFVRADVRYIRVTNLDTAAWIEVAIVTTASNYQVLLTPGTSHILAQAEAVAVGETDTSPAFGSLENLASIQVKPVGVSFDPQVEIFVAVA